MENFLPSSFSNLFKSRLKNGYSNESKENSILSPKEKQLLSLSGSIAHEMRNPLSAISMSAQFLKEEINKAGLSNEVVDQFLGIIETSAINAFNAIDIILNNIRNGKINNSDFKLLSIADTTKQALKLYPFKNDERSKVILDVKNDFNFFGSDTLLFYTLFNLLKNSLYYLNSYPQSTITITIKSAADGNYLIFKDTGPGISEDKLNLLFQDFMTSDKKEGTGLGLSFCRKVMESFGGSIKCDSVVGEYTEFRLGFGVK